MQFRRSKTTLVHGAWRPLPRRQFDHDVLRSGQPAECRLWNALAKTSCSAMKRDQAVAFESPGLVTQSAHALPILVLKAACFLPNGEMLG